MFKRAIAISVKPGIEIPPRRNQEFHHRRRSRNERIGKEHSVVGIGVGPGSRHGGDVGTHVKSIYRKLAVNSRGEAVYSAMRSGQLKV